MKIKTRTITEECSLLNSIILSSLKKKHFDAIGIGDSDKELELTLTINGVDLNPTEYFEYLDENIKGFIEERAHELALEKFNELMDQFDKTKDIVEQHMRDMMIAAGITTGEE